MASRKLLVCRNGSLAQVLTILCCGEGLISQPSGLGVVLRVLSRQRSFNTEAAERSVISVLDLKRSEVTASYVGCCHARL
jgi:hypothetical protein